MNALNTQVRNQFTFFWNKHPALFLGFSLFLGTSTVFSSPLLLICLELILLMSYSRRALQVAALLLFLTGCWTTPIRYPPISLPAPKLTGRGQFHIETLKVQASPFHKSLLCKGILRSFQSEEKETFHNIPCALYLPLHSKHIDSSCDYLIYGTLLAKERGCFVLKPEKNTPWKAVENTHSFALWRYEVKQKLGSCIKREISNPQAATLLSALATGMLDERVMMLEFAKVGIQHILAISGFHFAFVALFLNALLRLFLPYSLRYSLLLVALTGYFFFLGEGPSIQRAYLAIALVILAKLLHLRISGLNALGSALCIEVAWNPQCVSELSFQLTFLCTLAILLYYPLIDRCLTQLFKTPSQHEALSSSLLQKHRYLLFSFLRKALSLNLAVTLLLLPLLLHLFHRFPLLSLLYNLFFPTCIALSMFFLCSALLFAPWAAAIASAIHALNNKWTSLLVYISANSPAALDFAIRTKAVSFTAVVLSLSVAILAGIYFQKIELEKK